MSLKDTKLKTEWLFQSTYGLLTAASQARARNSLQWEETMKIVTTQL